MSPASPTAPLVLGAGGLIGRAVADAMEESFPGTVSATRAEIDVTDRFRLEAEVERLRPDLIINCAAYADVEGCEIDRDRARKVNAEGAENAARAAAALRCPIVQLSTDLVFDGSKETPYTEDDPPAPLSEYGRTRLDGERRVAAAAPDHLIVRTSWPFGPGRVTFVDAIRAGAHDGLALRAADDQTGSPTYAIDLGGAVRLLLLRKASGLVHFANTGSCTRYALARAILSDAGPAGASLQPIRGAGASRNDLLPANSALDTSKFTRLTGTTPRPWREALRDYLGSDGRRAAGA